MIFYHYCAILTNVGKSIDLNCVDGNLDVRCNNKHGGNTTDQQTSSNLQKISSYEEVHRFIVDGLVGLRFVDTNTLEQEIVHNGGDLDIDSEEGAAIAHGLEGVVGRELVAQKDFKRENFTSVKRLADLLQRNLQKPVRKGSQKLGRKRST